MTAANTHRALLEATNQGHYFADCTCGWSGGVHDGRAQARAAHKAHVEGSAPVDPVKTTFLIGPPAQGMTLDPEVTP